MIIFITGATGFIGVNLVESLISRGHKAICLARSPEKAALLPSHGLVKPVFGDLSECGPWKPHLRDADMVVHLAGVTRARNAAKYSEGNVGTTRVLMQALKAENRADIPICFVSSQAASGPCATSPGMDETAPAQPVSHYGRSKLEAEALVRAGAAGRAIILRPSMVYGPGDRDFLPMFKAAKSGLMLTHRRDWPVSIVHVDDVVRFLIKTVESPDLEGTYFLADGGPRNWADVLESIAHAVKKHPRILPVPLPVIWALTRLTGFLTACGMPPAYLNPDKYREMRQPGWTCDPTRAMRILGEDSTRNLAEGMRQTAQWYLNKGQL